MPILSPFNQQMETHASDEISKERQRRSQQGGGGGGGGDVDGLEGGMAGVSLREGEDDDAEANAENDNGEKRDDGGGGDNEDDDVDDDDEDEDDCDYVPENYHDDNSKKGFLETLLSHSHKYLNFH